MPYSKTTWQNGVTPVNAANLQKIEDELEALAAAGSDLVDAAGDLLVGSADNTFARLPVGTLGQVLTRVAGTPFVGWGPGGIPDVVKVDNGVLTYKVAGGAYVLQKLTDAQIDPAAAIDPAKLKNYPNDPLRFLNGQGGWTAPPGAGAQIDYQQIVSSPAAITATTEATAVAFITGNSVAYDGSRVKVEVFVTLAHSNIVGNLVLYRDSTVLTQSFVKPATSVYDTPVKLEFFDTPSAGNHVYKVGAFTASGSLLVHAGPGGSGSTYPPAFLRTTRA